MASLHARLIAGLLALAAVGLLALGGITYAEQRSFLLERADRQAQTAAPAIERALDDEGVRRPSGTPGMDRYGRHGGRDPGPPDGGTSLPPGTYGQRRDDDGTVLGHVSLSYGQSDLPAPALRRSLCPPG
jgi:two-component system, OmpR family, sensor kinase